MSKSTWLLEKRELYRHVATWILSTFGDSEGESGIRCSLEIIRAESFFSLFAFLHGFALLR